MKFFSCYPPFFCFRIPVFLFLLFYPLSFAGAEELNYQPSGPFSIGNQMPMYIFYMSMAPEEAKTLKNGKLGVEIGYHAANTIVAQHDEWTGGKAYEDLTYWMIVDSEVARLYADIKYGISDNLEVGINIPYFDYSGGYLDSFIESFEDAISCIKIPNARAERSKDEYEFVVDHYGERLIEDYSNPDGLGEITIETKYRILEETHRSPTISLRAALKLPTSGDSSKLLGSDKIDCGFGLLADKKLLDRLFMYFNFNVIFIQKPDILDKLDVDNYMLSGLLGMEFFLGRRTSMIVQTFINSSVYEEGISTMERAGVVVSAGFSHNFSDKISWQIAAEENVTGASPDFGIFTSLKMKL